MVLDNGAVVLHDEMRENEPNDRKQFILNFVA